MGKCSAKFGGKGAGLLEGFSIQNVQSMPLDTLLDRQQG
jgi:hypothetical protein